MAIRLKQALDDYFKTNYTARFEHAFGRLYAPVPDRRLEIVRFVRSTDDRSFRCPAGILAPPTKPTVGNSATDHTEMTTGLKVRFAYQFHSSPRGTWSELSPWTALYTITAKKVTVSGFDAPRDGRVFPGKTNAFDIDQIWVYAAYETTGGYCDIGTMVIDCSAETTVSGWDKTLTFDMAEDMLVRGTPAPSPGVHEIPPAVQTVSRHGNRLLMAGQIQRRFGSVKFPDHINDDTVWPNSAQVFITPNLTYRVDEDNEQLTRARGIITGCFIDDSYIGYDLYCEDRFVGTVMDIVQSTNPTTSAVIPYENNPPYSCTFYLWGDWKGKDYTAGTTDFYFVGHPNRVWIGGYDSEQSPDGTPFVRPETVHPLSYVDLDPGEDNAIQDILGAGDYLSYVLCKRGVWLISGGQMPGVGPSVQVRKIDATVGEIAPRSGMLLTNGSIQFISKDGVYQADTSGVRKISTGIQRIFAGTYERDGSTNEFAISDGMIDDIASAMVRGQDSPVAVHAGFSRGDYGVARSAWMTQDLATGMFNEHDRVIVTSNILGDAQGIFPPICGDHLGRVKEILVPDVFTDMYRDTDAPGGIGYTCRWQSAPFTFDGLEHKAAFALLTLKARTSFTLYLYLRAGYSLDTPITKSYAAAKAEEAGPLGWKDESITGVLFSERVTVIAGDEDYRIYLPQISGKEMIVELRWMSDAGPLDVSKCEIWGE
jgi:hypothetical protein